MVRLFLALSIILIVDNNINIIINDTRDKNTPVADVVADIVAWTNSTGLPQYIKIIYYKGITS